jgi:hypothetical protein
MITLLLPQQSIATNEPDSSIDVLLEFEAPDNCGGGATNVTIEVYSNEIDDVTAELETLVISLREANSSAATRLQRTQLVMAGVAET